jgi:hypothetical protein
MARITIDFELKSTDGSLGGLRTAYIAIGESGKIDAWMPYGHWMWHPIGGGLKAIPEYWRQKRQGAWAWEMETPDKGTLLFVIDGEYEGRLENFSRDGFARGVRGLAGPWLFEHDDYKYHGTWWISSIGYER